jgi:hypothetical protein
LCPHIVHEQGKATIEKYDKKSLFPMFLKYSYHLDPLVEFERDVVEQRIEEDRSLDIFGMIVNISDPTIELVNIELVIFRCYQVDVKDIKWPPQWWEKHESMFFHSWFLCWKNLRNSWISN